MSIDLSLVAPPDAVEELAWETIRDEMLADLDERMLAVDPTWTTPEPGDPVYRLIEVVAYRELLIRQRTNDAVRAVLLASSTGNDLKQIVALLGVEGEGKTDTQLRAAWFEALWSLSTAGPRQAYIAIAKRVAGVRDAWAWRPIPGTVQIVVLAEAGDGTAGAELLSAVAAAASDEDVRPLCDTVEVVSAEIVHYSIDGLISVADGPDPAVVLERSQESAEAYAAARHFLGQRVTPATATAALVVPGVDGVTLEGLSSPVITTRLQAPYADVVQVALEG